mgnify:CR=1 FL=1
MTANLLIDANITAGRELLERCGNSRRYQSAELDKEHLSDVHRAPAPGGAVADRQQVSEQGFAALSMCAQRGKAAVEYVEIQLFKPSRDAALGLSVAVPHEVLAVTASRPRVAATGWFHEELPGIPG